MPARRSIRLIARLAVYAAALLIVFVAPTVPRAPTALTAPTAPTAPTVRLAIAAVLLTGLLVEISTRRQPWR